MAPITEKFRGGAGCGHYCTQEIQMISPRVYFICVSLLCFPWPYFHPPAPNDYPCALPGSYFKGVEGGEVASAASDHTSLHFMVQGAWGTKEGFFYMKSVSQKPQHIDV